MESLIDAYFNLNSAQRQQFAALGPLYAASNAKVNLISRRDIGNLYGHHVLPSLAIAKVISFLPAARILDLGTGGGFPGLPLAILSPASNFLLVDSIAKKIAAVQSIVGQLGLDNVETVCCRAEDLTGRFDFVVARGVGRLDKVWPLAWPLISPVNRHELANGLFYLKGGPVESELPAGINLRRWPLSRFYEDAFFESKALLLLTSR